MPGSAREEAERLVAAFLARAAVGDGFGHLGESVTGLLSAAATWSNGSPECCACPLCRAIAAVRDPSPETAERLATSAGDIASGMATLMRGLSSLAAQPSRPPAPRARPAKTPDQAWAAATRVEDEPVAPDERTDPWGAASAADARAAEAARAQARAEAAAARARAAAAAEAVARAVEQSRAARTGDVWAMATTTETTRSVDHELGATAPEDRDPGPGDDAAPGAAV